MIDTVFRFAYFTFFIDFEVIFQLIVVLSDKVGLLIASKSFRNLIVSPTVYIR